jgi:di/tricarboxylate transporter
MIPTSFLSAFLNNTPIVAMLLPRIQEFSRRRKTPASKLLIPLSYAAILGGITTLIGTSTNIVVSGLMEAEGLGAMQMFELSLIGIPAIFLVVIFFVVVGHRLLPDGGANEEDFAAGLQDVMFEVRIATNSELVGQTAEEAGLRALEDAFLVHIRRDDRLLQISPNVYFEDGDVLTFSGNVSILEDLLARPGLETVVESYEHRSDQTLPLYDAVVAENSSLVGKTLKETNFRETYGGVVLGILRRDIRSIGPLGRVPIKAGDLLIIESLEGFDRRWNARRDEFYLVASRRLATTRPRLTRAPIAIAILLAMVGLAATNVLPIVTAAFCSALAMILLRCIRFSEAKQSIDVSVLIVIAAALGFGKAIDATGLADVSARSLITLTSSLGTVGVLITLYAATNLMTELITHKAAAVLMFPVAMAMASELGLDPRALALVVAVGAAASFMTPIGYQTNLMVMSAGSYRYKDYLKVGFPVSLIVMAVTVFLVNTVYL